MDSFITALIFLIISAVAAWYKKKQGGREEGAEESEMQRPFTRPEQSRPTAGSPPPLKPTSWEEELRRLLEGETQTTPPPRRPVSPPPVVRLPAPIPAPSPVLARPVSVPQASVPPLAVPKMEEITRRDLGRLEEARRVYDRASQLDKSVSQHIERVSGEQVKLTTVTHKQVSPEVAQVISLFKSPQAARQAVIASIIFSPPKALEQNEPAF
ncbi:MAG: hypothetical protein JWQ71_2949 [Pedosphaera sp.]|nr:hypothetical protein [Pedosphaera sp.]